jgi:hypothetical protein
MEAQGDKPQRASSILAQFRVPVRAVPSGVGGDLYFSAYCNVLDTVTHQC